MSKSKKPRSTRKPRPARKPRSTSTRRSRAAVAPDFEGRQAMIPGVEPKKREPEQPDDKATTVQTLRVTRREVRRWSAAAEAQARANGRSWGHTHAMTWARGVLNDAAAKLLGTAL